jgi:hypothetical protein
MLWRCFSPTGKRKDIKPEGSSPSFTTASFHPMDHTKYGHIPDRSGTATLLPNRRSRGKIETMSTHPNAILLLVLKPDDLTRKTYRAILEEAGREDDLMIGGDRYNIEVMESTYDESHQIAADEGDIVVFDMVTYGYGERIEWDKLVAQKSVLEEWAAGICERHKCTASFYVTANYW